MIDSHCHLEYPAFDKDLPQVIENAKKAGVKAVVNAGNKPSDNRKVLAMQKKIGSNFFKAVLSLSPHFAPQAKESLDEELRFIESNKNNIVGIGETGLDFYHFEKPEDQKIQKKAFEAFLQLAESLDKPVVVHSRSAEKQCLEILSKYKARVVMHCFLKHQVLNEVLKAEFKVSLPTLKSKTRVKIIKRTPIESLFCETDSPFLWKGRNEPANVREVYEEIARQKKTSFEKVEEAIDSNVCQFYKL